MGIALKRTKLEMDLNLRGEVAETEPFADAVRMPQEVISKSTKLNRVISRENAKSTKLHSTLPVDVITTPASRRPE